MHNFSALIVQLWLEVKRVGTLLLLMNFVLARKYVEDMSVVF